jgi:hypothetical protein
MSTTKTTHYYSLGNAIGFFFIGTVLLILSGGMLLSGILSLWAVLACCMAVGSVVFGFQGITKRKKYPMVLDAEHLTFYRKGQQIRIPIQDITRVWYNTKGIDKRVSLALRNGSIEDIPVLYGLDELRKKIQKQYNLPNK